MECPVAAAARRDPARLALEFGAARWSWAELDGEVGAWAVWLGAQGVGAGDRVGVLSWNRPEVLFLWFAAARLGAAMVPFNARLTATELAPLVTRAEPKLVVCDDSLIDRLPGAGTRVIPFPSLPRAPSGPAVLDPSRVVAALFTSGTTGVPSLVPLTVGNFVASHEGNAVNLGADAGQVWLGMLPLFHVGGLAMAFRWALMGARLVLERQFDAARAAQLLRRGDVTHASFVPTALARVLDQGEAPFAPSLRALLIGGGPMGVELLARARQQALPVLQTYGLTEACSQVTTERPSEADGATAGVALAGVSVRLRHESGRLCGVDEVGEIEVRGPTVTPAADGWLLTRDLGSLDARGRLTVLARRTDLIVSGGENIYPAEVEAALLASGLVDDVAVAPVASETWGQVPVAFVVWRGPEAVEALARFAQGRLAGFKVPKQWVTVTALPRNASGKLLRHQLPRPPFPAVTRS
jgi:O-succinylbenzoic acid--CoA ligase